MITSQNRPGLPDFSRATLKNMGRPGYEAMCIVRACVKISDIFAVKRHLMCVTNLCKFVKTGLLINLRLAIFMHNL